MFSLDGIGLVGFKEGARQLWNPLGIHETTAGRRKINGYMGPVLSLRLDSRRYLSEHIRETF